ncbi:PQQ-binding-like beta-propeller repeat protein [Pseudoalteromonas luteoviolacea]|uniref:outer membrane protein assembly factor BamB family protein n=1 Tax=Pseudoalteromonas luteoviolacea TaxID=43657 RepID=UPI001B36E2BF|nr:PQQ-binding-like beta-propeller repeat protein [Pseudoalteromonas luteoviolacea]MBQ4837995.1 PQQ-binding-like beta-propeller repeat protein [Pseudoalteromonas luteoviolacea]
MTIYKKIIAAFILGLLSILSTVTALAKSGDYLYSYQTGSENWGSITLKNHQAYFGSDNGKVYAFDIDRVKTRWVFTTGDKVRSKPLVDHHRVFFSSDDGYLYALNRWNGKLLWKASLNDSDHNRILPANHAPWEFDYTKSSPVADSNFVYVGSADSNFYAISKRTGKIQWRFNTGGMIRATASIYQGKVFVASWDGYVYALDKQSGELAWQFKTQGAIPSSPVILDDILIIGSRDTYLYGLDPHSGQVVWKKALPGGSWVESSAVADTGGDYFYIGSSDAKLLFKMAVETGEIVWQVATPGWSWGQPVVDQKHVYIGSTGHDEPGWYVTQRGFMALERESGTRAWHYQPTLIPGFVHGGVYASPAVGAGKVLVPDLDGFIHVYQQ